VDWSAENIAYVVLWNQRQTHRMYYLSGVILRPGLNKEYLRWLHLPAFSEAGLH
jgi:hypothetical protein